MKKLLLVVDMQNDFVTGSLGTQQAVDIVPNIKDKVLEFRMERNPIIFTKDTHYDNYLETQEGKNLPVAHCIKGMPGHEIVGGLDTSDCFIFEKGSFGSLELAEYISKREEISEIEICGLCTDICVVSNALIIKAKFPEIKITVDSNACAGVTKESHEAALLVMKMCQVNVIM
ncbi:MAG: cysteine hydrolase [Defluviitaleaceae bacterium]|nr:cysteine hydrolase [Defluviitaleaceae bacterium]MCL2837109.1 cysteine hydrolase [Defluviitaleaceae bacterium]